MDSETKQHRGSQITVSPPHVRGSVGDLPLIGIALIGLFLRLYRLGSQSFWYDESYQVDLSSFSPPHIINAMLGNMPDYGPASHILFHYWLKVGSSDFWVRLLPALSGVGAIYVIYLLGTRLMGRRSALIAAFLLAISPLHVYYSQEARAYSFAILLNCLSMVFFLRSIERRDWRNRMPYILITTLALYNHVYAIFTIMAQIVYLMFTQRVRDRATWQRITDPALCVALYSPWIFHLMKMLGHPVGFSKPVGITALVYAFYAFCFRDSIGPSVSDLHTQASVRSFIPYIAVLAPLSVVFVYVFVRGIIAAPEEAARIPRPRLFLLSWLLTPMIAAFGVTQLTGVTFNVRYVVTALPAFIMILAMGVAPLSRTRRALALTLLTLACAYSINNYYFDPRYYKDDIGAAATYLSRTAERSDSIAVGDWRTFRRYYTGRASWFRSGGLFHRDGGTAAELRRLKSEHYSRLWVVMNRPWATDPSGEVMSALERRFVVEERKRFAQVEVVCFQLSSAAPKPVHAGDH